MSAGLMAGAERVWKLSNESRKNDKTVGPATNPHDRILSGRLSDSAAGVCLNIINISV